MKEINKLVRDRIPEICISNGETPVTRVLSDEEFRVELDKKITEEARELVEAEDPEKVLNEAGDLIETAFAKAALYGYSEEEVMAARDNKRVNNGGFSKRIFLETVRGNDDK